MAMPAKASTRKYLKGEQTRDTILSAARKLFKDNGYHNTSVYDLFDRAGITKGAFYHHWRTKEDLALTLLEEMKVAYQNRIFSILDGPGSARDLIEKTFATITELSADPDWHYCELIATWSTELGPEDAQLGRAVHEVRHGLLAFWERLLGRAQTEGQMRTDISAKDLSFLVVSTICGVTLSGKRTCGGGANPNAINTLQRLLFA